MSGNLREALACIRGATSEFHQRIHKEQKMVSGCRGLMPAIKFIDSAVDQSEVGGPCQPAQILYLQSGAGRGSAFLARPKPLIIEETQKMLPVL